MISPMEIAAILAAGIVLFGADKLPKLARSVGEMKREFHQGQQEGEIEGSTPVTPTAPVEAKDHEQHPA
jgi:TatA/E family protein of Tat protein translocase